MGVITGMYVLTVLGVNSVCTECYSDGSYWPGYSQTKLNRRFHVGLGRVLSFSSINVINDSVRNAVGCMPLRPCRHCVEPDNRDSGGKAQLSDWLPQKHIGSRKKCIAPIQTLLPGGQNQIAGRTGWGLPSLRSYYSVRGLEWLILTSVVGINRVASRFSLVEESHIR